MTIFKYPILYSFRRCPYAMRVRFCIRMSGIKVELREILLKKKPKEFLDSSFDGTVPILIIASNKVIQESLDIVNWVSTQNKNENLKIFDPKNLISNYDTNFKYNLDRYKYPTRYEGIDPIYHRNENVKYLTSLNEQLSSSKFLSSDELNFLDYCIFPFVRQFRNVDHLWFESLNLVYLNKWYSLIVESREFNDIMKKYKVWESSDTPILTDFIY